MNSQKPIAKWIWLVAGLAWIGFFSELEWLPIALPFHVMPLAGGCILVLSGYVLWHCWTNPTLSSRTKVNWLAAVCVTWILGATGYLLWWRFDSAKRVPTRSPVQEQIAREDPLRTLMAARWVILVRSCLIAAWTSFGLFVFLLLWGYHLVSLEALAPLVLCLSSSAVAMIWATRVLEALEPEGEIATRLAWSVLIVGTWFVGATLAWQVIRRRCPAAPGA